MTKLIRKRFTKKSWEDKTSSIISAHNQRSTDDNKLILSDSDHWSYNKVVFYGKRLYEYGF